MKVAPRLAQVEDWISNEELERSRGYNSFSIKDKFLELEQNLKTYSRKENERGVFFPEVERTDDIYILWRWNPRGMRIIIEDHEELKGERIPHKITNT